MRLTAMLLAGSLLAAPGLGLTLALWPPGRISLPVRTALVLPLGYACVGGLSLVLVLLRLHGGAAVVAGYGLVTATVWGVALRRPRSRGPRLEAADRVALLGGLGLLVGYVAVRLTYGPAATFLQTPLRYWADGLEIADAGRIPDRTLQWGELLSPATSKTVLNSFHATASLLLGRGPLEPMSELLVIVAVGLALVFFGLAWELGLRFTAPLIPVALFANRLLGNREMTQDLSTYLAENWGRLVAFAALLIAVRVVRAAYARGEGAREEGKGAHHVRVDATASGLVFGIAAGTHLVPVVVALALLACYAGMLALVERTLRPALRTAVPLGAAALTVALAVMVLPGGDLGFEGAVGRAEYDAVREDLGLPESFDPTLYLAKGELEQQAPPRSEPFYAPPGLEARQFLSAAIGQRKVVEGAVVWLAPLAGLLLVAAAVLWGPRDQRVAAIAAALWLGVLLAVTLAFLYRYDLFALAHFGRRRLFAYSAPAIAVVLGAAVDVVLLRFDRWARARSRGLRWSSLALGLLLVVAVGAIFLPGAGPREDQLDRRRAALEPLAWIREHVPCEGRILMDRRTLATFMTLTSRAGVIEGMGPHIRPEVLAVALEELLEAHRFFDDPAAGAAYLRDRDVAAVVLTRPNHRFGGWTKLRPDLRGIRPGSDPASTDPFRDVPFLEVALVSPAATVYRVVDAGQAPRGLPRVRTLPGYRCR